MKCLRWQHENPPQAKFCVVCGAPVDGDARLARSHADLQSEIETLRTSLSDSRERQAATEDILRIISRSQTDVQPVFDTIADSAIRLLQGWSALILLYDGELLHLGAVRGGLPDSERYQKARFPMRLQPDHLLAQCIVDRFPRQHPDACAHPNPLFREMARRRGYGAFVTVPMLRGDDAIGEIVVTRAKAGPFEESAVALLQTFADQAVIAIENVRLFRELQTSNHELTEALEQQTATADILRAISRSPTDLQPVLDTIAGNAALVCSALDATVQLREGAIIRIAAHSGPIPRSVPETRVLARTFATGRAILDREPVQIRDIEAPEADEFGHYREAARQAGFRTLVAVPMLREGAAIGSLTMRRREAQPFTDKEVALLQTFADQAVIAIENVRLFTELQDKNAALTQAHAQVIEALEQQTATSEILRVISQSQTDVGPVFEAIVDSAVRLLRAYTGTLTRVVGEHIVLEAFTRTDAAGDIALQARFPVSLASNSSHALALRDRAPLNVAEAEADPRLSDWAHGYARVRGYRSQVVVPLLRQADAIGTISVTRREPGGFETDEIVLIQTFADQAVIAIENVRLFTELQEKNRALTQAHAQVTEALERQTATSDILKVMASSPTATQPVFDTIAENAARLCAARDAQVLQVDGDVLRLVSAYGLPSMPAVRSISRGHAVGRAVIDRQTIHVRDMAQAIAEFPETTAPQHGVQSVLAVPLVRHHVAIGVIRVSRTEIRPFTDAQIALLQTFADQAVIAIENVRLFNETRDALERQTATAEVLRVLSSSPTNVQPVMQTIVDSVIRLADADDAMIGRAEGDQIRWLAAAGTQPGPLQPISRSLPSGRAILDRRTSQVNDISVYGDEFPAVAAAYRKGVRTILATPLLREGNSVGVVLVRRTTVRPFTDQQIALLKTFADQAVIAIENVRLFKELEARTAALMRSVDQLTALGEVGRAVSSTLDLETVLSTIVARAVELSGLDGGVVFEYDDEAEEFVQRVATETGGALVEVRRTTRIRKGEGVLGRTAITLEPVQVPDITAPGAYEGRLRETLIASGIRAILAVPMVRTGQLIGCLGVTRNLPGEFPTETIELLRTFATQSALAIQNARLFHEIEDKSRQLEAASRHKSEFLANMSHELRTPLNAVIGFSEVLAERMFGELNEKQEEYLKDIHASGQHLLSLINDILDLSKIEAGRMELELSDFSLPATLDNALTLVRERAGRHGIALHVTTDERVGQVRADERKIRQVILNLLSNAIKFTPEGGRIAVGAGPGDGVVEVSVSDTGVGIAPEDQEAIFEEFRQVGTAAKKVEGTGLGLALSRKFIELHGGRIWVHSQVGEGSRFTFTIPVRHGA